jgi:threonine dehydratase
MVSNIIDVSAQEKVPKFSDIFAAFERIKPFINHTPVLSSAGINKLVESELYFKCENFQKVGAFKYRGAMNSVLNSPAILQKNGFATHSSGNHAAALSLAAQKINSRAFVVMPENAPAVKKKAVKSYGAEITWCKPTLEAREKTLLEVIERTNATFIHPYNNPFVIAGQGTVAIELLEEVKDLDIIIAPVGGGGLISGISIAAKYLNPKLIVIGAEPEMANDAYRSFLEGKIIPSIDPKTIADGLLSSLGTLTFQIIRSNVDEIFTASEISIISAMRLIWERMKIIAEPSSSVPLAIILENKGFFKNKKIGIIISGGNVDLDKLPFAANPQ